MSSGQIVLVGTSHRYQIASDDFQRLLTSLCSERGVAAIAEELNAAALAERGAVESVASAVATELGLKHQFSDPSPEIREEIGVEAENEIRSTGFLHNWTRDQIEAEVRKSHEIREAYWLTQLRIFDSWPLLFVCGANHSEPFAALLRRSGFDVTVANSDWAPLKDRLSATLSHWWSRVLMVLFVWMVVGGIWGNFFPARAEKPTQQQLQRERERRERVRLVAYGKEGDAGPGFYMQLFGVPMWCKAGLAVGLPGGPDSDPPEACWTASRGAVITVTYDNDTERRFTQLDFVFTPFGAEHFFELTGQKLNPDAALE
jgi:hypothetical protein